MEKKIVCRRCGETFTITEQEQKWYEEKGFELPKNCSRCRAAKREERNNGEKKN